MRVARRDAGLAMRSSLTGNGHMSLLINMSHRGRQFHAPFFAQPSPVVPAKAGTHTPCPLDSPRPYGSRLSLRSAGTTGELLRVGFGGQILEIARGGVDRRGRRGFAPAWAAFIGPRHMGGAQPAFRRGQKIIR